MLDQLVGEDHGDGRGVLLCYSLHFSRSTLFWWLSAGLWELSRVVRHHLNCFRTKNNGTNFALDSPGSPPGWVVTLPATRIHIWFLVMSQDSRCIVCVMVHLLWGKSYIIHNLVYYSKWFLIAVRMLQQTQTALTDRVVQLPLTGLFVASFGGKRKHARKHVCFSSAFVYFWGDLSFVIYIISESTSLLLSRSLVGL